MAYTVTCLFDFGHERMKIKIGKRLKTQQKDILYIISLARGEQSIGDGCSRADGAVNFGSHIEETAVPSGSQMHISVSFFIYCRRSGESWASDRRRRRKSGLDDGFMGHGRFCIRQLKAWNSYRTGAARQFDAWFRTAMMEKGHACRARRQRRDYDG